MVVWRPVTVGLLAGQASEAQINHFTTNESGQIELPSIVVL